MMVKQVLPQRRSPERSNLAAFAPDLLGLAAQFCRLCVVC